MGVLDYQDIYKAAAAKYGVPASVLAGDVQIESGGDPNSVSPTGAFGLTQFEPSTAASYGVQRGTSRGAVTSQIMGQAHYLSDLGFKKDPALALSKYNAGPGNPGAAGNYASMVLAAAKKYAGLDKQIANALSGGSPNKIPTVGSGTTSVTTNSNPGPNVFDVLGGLEATREAMQGKTSPGSLETGWNALSSIWNTQHPATQTTTVGPQSSVNSVSSAQGSLPSVPGKGDINPLHHFTIGRTDMGVDANAAPGTPIVAPNDSKVVGSMANWYRGQPYVALKILSGPNRGKVWYVAEQIDHVPATGTIFRRGQAVTRYASSGTGIEIGWANPSNPLQTLAQATTGYSEGQQTTAGKQFRNFLGVAA